MFILVIIIIGLIIYFYHKNHKPVHADSSEDDKQKEAKKQDNIKFNRVSKELQDAEMVASFLYLNKNELVNMLDDDEHIIDGATGWGKKNSSAILLTDSRVILFDKNNWIGHENKEVPLDMLNSISTQSKVMSSVIRVTNGADTMWIKDVPIDTARTFVNKTRKQAREFKRKLMHA